MSSDGAAAPGWSSRLAWAGYVLGLALGGLFDGILLHQVLQWHHLLSLVPGESLRQLERQVFADGVFHIAMYGLAVLGLLLLWGARKRFAEPAAGRRLLAATLIGFGVWNVIDVVFFHWVLHIHRIRVDVPADDRLRWDLLWLALFAVPPLLLAWRAARPGGGSSVGRATPAALGILMLGFAGLSMRTPPDADARVVLFSDDVSLADAYRAVAAANGQILWSKGRLVGVRLPRGSGGWGLYRSGALLVGGPGSPAACLSWSKV